MSSVEVASVMQQKSHFYTPWIEVWLKLAVVSYIDPPLPIDATYMGVYNNPPAIYHCPSSILGNPNLPSLINFSRKIPAQSSMTYQMRHTQHQQRSQRDPHSRKRNWGICYSLQLCSQSRHISHCRPQPLRYCSHTGKEQMDSQLHNKGSNESTGQHVVVQQLHTSKIMKTDIQCTKRFVKTTGNLYMLECTTQLGGIAIVSVELTDV